MLLNLNLNHSRWGLGILAVVVFNNKQSSSCCCSKSNVKNLKVNDFMGHRSMRKKNNILKQQQSMPPPSTFNSNTNPSSSIKTRHVVVLVSLLSAVAVIALSFNTWSFFRSDAGHRGILSDEKVYSYEVVNVFPHDPNAFTQGLLYGGNDTLLESTGLNGQSSVREVDLQTGKIKKLQNMDYSYFGEGLTLLGKRLYQVTWLGKTGFIYDRHNLSKFQTFTHEMKDGWGLATDGKVLFGTDGSSSLYKLNPRTMKVIKEHVVRYEGHEVHNLNELEYINNEVWANIWQSDCIARISPADGTVIGWILLPELRQGLLASGNRIDVLNGIAWDEDKNRTFVTGKLWPKLYEIKLQTTEETVAGTFRTSLLASPCSFLKEMK